VIQVEIPGRGLLTLKYLVSDFTGTLSVDGVLVPGIKEKLNELSKYLEIHILTADTFGKAREALKGINAKVVVLEPGEEAFKKLNYINKLGKSEVVAFGNGGNDELMLKEAALSIAVMLEEGCATKTLLSADVLVKSPLDAVDLLLNTKRLIAVLRR